MATEYISKIRSSSGQGIYTTLTLWAAATQEDLTASTTKVFGHGGVTGTISDGVTVTGGTSGATGVVINCSTSQILLKSITSGGGGTFQSGETVSYSSNSVVLSDAGDSAIAVAEGYADWGSGLDDNVTVSGATVGASNYREIRSATGERHDGTPGTGFILTQTADLLYNLTFGEDYARVTGIAIDGSQGTRTRGISSATTSDNVTLCYNLLYDHLRESIYLDCFSSEKYVYENVIITGSNSSSDGIYFSRPNSFNTYIANCTIIITDYGDGIQYANGDSSRKWVIKNTLIHAKTSNGVCFKTAPIGDITNIDYNASSDSSLSGYSGSNNRYSQTFTFADAGNDDYHLDSSDAGAKGYGTNLYSTFTLDVDGETWPSSGAWDIGADYYVSSGSTYEGSTTLGSSFSSTRTVLSDYLKTITVANSLSISQDTLIDYLKSLTITNSLSTSQTNTTDYAVSITLSETNSISQVSSLLYEVLTTLSLTNTISQDNDISIEVDITIPITNSISQDTITDYLTTINISQTNGITQSNICTFTGLISLDITETISQIGSLDYSDSISLSITESINQASLISLEVSTILAELNSISQVSTVDYTTDITLSESNSINQVSIIDYIESIIISVNNNISSVSNVDFNAAFIQNITKSITETATIETTGDAAISIGIQLADQYTNTAILDTNALLSLQTDLVSLVGNIIEALNSLGLSTSIAQVSNISIEGVVSIGLEVDITQSVLAILEASFTQSIDLTDFRTSTGIYLVDFLSNLTLEETSTTEAILFTSTELGATIGVSQNGLLTAFVVETPTKRIILSLSTDRISVSFGTERLNTSLNNDRDVTIIH